MIVGLISSAAISTAAGLMTGKQHSLGVKGSPILFFCELLHLILCRQPKMPAEI